MLLPHGYYNFFMYPILRLPYCLLALCFLTTLAVPLEKRDADFASVRTHLIKDHSGKKGDPPGKYFHESTVSAIHLSYYFIALVQVRSLKVSYNSSTRTTMAASRTKYCQKPSGL